MATFTLYIRDNRYAVPTLALVGADGEERVRELARQRLLESTQRLRGRAIAVQRDARVAPAELAAKRKTAGLSTGGIRVCGERRFRRLKVRRDDGSGTPSRRRPRRPA